MRQILSVIGFLFFTLMAGYAVSQFPLGHVFLGLVALLVFVFSFINVEFGLYLLIFSMLLSPEFVVGGTGGGSLDRGVTIRLDDFLLIVIGAGWFARNAVYKELGLFLKTPLNTPLFLYLLACAVATAWGIMAGRVDPKTGIFYVLKYFEYFIVFFMTVNHVRDKSQINRFVFCLFLTCLIVSAIGFLQIPGGGRVSAPFEGETGEPNTFGGYLLFMMAIASGIFLYSENSRIRELTAALMVFMIPPFLFTQSRASYLAMLPMLLVVSLFSKKRLYLVSLLIIAVIISPVFLPSAIKDRVLYTFMQPAHQNEAHVVISGIRLDTSTSARIMSIKEAVWDWTQSPLLGYGITGYRFIDPQYPRVLVETGALGMVTFMLLIFTIFKMAVFSLRRAVLPFHRGICAGYIAGVVGLLFHALTANTFTIVRIMEPFWFFTGIVFVISTLDDNSSEMIPGEE